MAKDMMHILRVSGWALLLLSAVPAISSTQVLVDPTKPPAELGANPEAAVPDANVLRSIIISPSRRAAIINGQTVELGEKAGDVRLIEVNEKGVVLQGENGRQVLTLFPDVKINKKAVLQPMEDDVNNPVLKKKRVVKHASRAGKKEEK
jgi:MSHA biogenesis protein MshK